MRRVHVLALTALLLTCGALLRAQQSNPPPPSNGDHAENRHRDSKSKEASPCPALQGTQAVPLWVKISDSRNEQPRPDSNKEKTQESSPSHWWNDPNWWVAGFTCLLAFIAIGQVILFGIQLWMMRVSLADSKIAADAARVAADAAKESAYIATNSERAWVVAEPTFSSNWPDLMKQGAPEKSRVILKLTNAGKTPAELEEIEVLAFIYPGDDALPSQPTYGTTADNRIGLNVVPGEIIQAGQDRVMICGIENFELLNDRDIENLRARKSRLYCYGRVVYKDISGLIRTTQFGHYFYTRKDRSDDKPEGMYRLPNRKYNYTS
jgi:hypothetical protein